MTRAGHRHRAGLLLGRARRRRRPRPARRAAARAGRPRAGDRGLRIAYEALAWGRHVYTWERVWDVVRRAGLTRRSASAWTASTCSPAAGTRRDRGDPRREDLLPPARRRPALDMDVLQWSRHHRLFPGQGAFDLPALPRRRPGRRLRGAAVARGLQRRLPPGRPGTGRRGRACGRCWRSRRPLAVRRPDLGLAAAPAGPVAAGYAFTELAVDGVSGPGARRRADRPGLHPHRPAPVTSPSQLWEQGAAPGSCSTRRVVRPAGAGAAEVGGPGPGEHATPARSAARAEALLAPVLPAHPRRRRGRPRRRRRPRRHRGLLLPAPGPTAGRRTSCRPGRTPARAPGSPPSTTSR